MDAPVLASIQGHRDGMVIGHTLKMVQEGSVFECGWTVALA
jgi:hypothetical protein